MSNLELKQQLTSQELSVFQSEFDQRKKTPLVAYLLWFFVGGVGGHRYYLGNVGMGVAMTLTLGGLGVWMLIDVFLINGRLAEINEQIEREVLQSVRGYRQAN